jgi:hypothetical protein
MKVSYKLTYSEEFNGVVPVDKKNLRFNYMKNEIKF